MHERWMNKGMREEKKSFFDDWDATICRNNNTKKKRRETQCKFN